MANRPQNKNLKMGGSPETQFKSGRQAVEMGRKGGLASGKAKRERRKMREVLDELLAESYTNPKTGEEIEGVTMLMVAAFNKARKGDMRALEFIRATLGEDPVKQLDVNGTLATDQAKFTELLEQIGETGA